MTVNLDHQFKGIQNQQRQISEQVWKAFPGRINGVGDILSHRRKHLPRLSGYKEVRENAGLSARVGEHILSVPAGPVLCCYQMLLLQVSRVPQHQTGMSELGGLSSTSSLQTATVGLYNPTSTVQASLVKSSCDAIPSLHQLGTLTNALSKHRLAGLLR